MASDNPPYFQVGSNVSARYKGAFCSANVKKVKRKVKVKVQFLSTSRPKLRLVMDDEVFGPLYVNATVRALDPDVGGLCDATVVQIIDRSIYTVVFNDGDVSTLSRSGVCTPGQRHYNAKDNLDNFPLLDPKEFSTPVVAGSQQQASTERTSRQLSRSQPVDNDVAAPPVQNGARNLTSEVPSLEIPSSLVRSCRQKSAAAASSSNAALTKPAKRPKCVQRKKKQSTKIFPVPKVTGRKAIGFKKQVWRTRKMKGNGTTQRGNGGGRAKVGRPKKSDLKEAAVLKVIDDMKQGSSVLRIPVGGDQRIGSTGSSECLFVQSVYRKKQQKGASKPKSFSVARAGQVSNTAANDLKEKAVGNCDEEEEQKTTDGSGLEMPTGTKEVPVLDTPNIELKAGPSMDDCRPCCSKQLKNKESGNKDRDSGYQRRNTRANASRPFPTTINEMYRELCLIVDEKKVEVPTTPPIGTHFNFVPENLELVTDTEEKQRLVITSLENLCVTYFGIKEYLNNMNQQKRKSKKK